MTQSHHITNSRNPGQESVNLMMVVMYGSPKLYPSDGFPGLHMHAVDMGLYQNSLATKGNTPAQQTFESHLLNQKAMILNGTIEDLFAGKFSSGVTGVDFLRFGENSIAIASTNAILDRSGKPVEPVVDNEAVVIDGLGFSAANDGIGKRILPTDKYAYYQVAKTTQTIQCTEQLFGNEELLLEYLRKEMGINTDQSFVALLPVTVAKKDLNSKTISGFDDDGSRRENFRSVLAKHRQWSEDNNIRPDVAHINSIKNFTVSGEIKFSAIEKALVRNPEVELNKGEQLLENKHYRTSSLHPDLLTKLEKGQNIAGVSTINPATGKPFESGALLNKWSNEIMPAAAKRIQETFRDYRNKIQTEKEKAGMGKI